MNFTKREQPLPQLTLSLWCQKHFYNLPFLPGEENKQALAYLKDMQTWRQKQIVIYGNEGCGKTHLAYKLREKSELLIHSRACLKRSPVEWLSQGRDLVLDVDDSFLEKRDFSLFLLRLLNLQREALNAPSLKIFARRAPSYWPQVFPDLTSRLAALVTVKIDYPGDVLLAQIFSQFFQSIGVYHYKKGVALVLSRLERSTHKIRDFILDINQHALSLKEPLSLSIIKQYVENAGKEEVFDVESES